MNTDTLKFDLMNLHASGKFFSITYINNINSHSLDWQEYAKSLSIETLIHNHEIAIAKGTVNSRAKTALPYAKRSRSLVLRAGSFNDLPDTTVYTASWLAEQLAGGFFTALDLRLARLYKQFNGTGTHECELYAIQEGNLYKKRYTDSNGFIHEIGEPKISGCPCSTLPLRNFSLNGIIALNNEYVS